VAGFDKLARQMEDHLQAAARLFRSKIADFDDLLTAQFLSGLRTQDRFDRCIEIVFEEERFSRRAAPAGNGYRVARLFQHQQARRKNGDTRAVALIKNRPDKVLGFAAPLRVGLKKNGADRWCCLADPFADLLLVETVVFAAIAFGAGRFRGLHEESLAVDEDPILEIHS
jgi:hypothetical protein